MKDDKMKDNKIKDNKIKETNDFFSQYNLSGDFSINTDVDYMSNDFGVSNDELKVTSDFGEGSQLNFDYGLGTTEYNPETTIPDMPDMMEALDSINIPDMPEPPKMQTASDIKAKKEAEAAARHVNDARASYNAHARVNGSAGSNMYAQQQAANNQQSQSWQQTANHQQGQAWQQAANAQQSQAQTQRQQTYYNQQASRQAKYARQNSPVLNQEQQYRLKELFTQFYIVNNNKQLAHDVSSWQVLFNEYEDKEDFANLRFVTAVVDTLERMEGVHLNVWRFFEVELFRYADNSPQWTTLRNRLQAARTKASREEQTRSYGNGQANATGPYQNARQSYEQTRQNWKNVQQNSTSAAYARQQMHMSARRAQKEEREKKTKVTVILWVIIGIVVLLWIIGSVGESTEPEYDYDDGYGYNYDIDIDYEKLKVEIPSVEFPTIVWSEFEPDSYIAKKYREDYSEINPYRMDVNADDYEDEVYFDSKTNKWIVNLYNTDKTSYEYYGTLTDCKKEFSKLANMYIVSCMVDPKENESSAGDGETESTT